MKGRRFFPLVVIAAALLAYHNSFTGEFIRDDVASIAENPTIRHLWPIWQALTPPHRGGLTVEGRPLINLSLAINYALGSYNVWGYHALNLTVHILAGLTLLGIVRRTLLQPPLRERFGAAANELALAVAVLWTVHPLQTESVTYVIQRAESMMGLFYLLTLYCFIRGAESESPRVWYSLSVLACASGMASKEVMVSAPVMVMLYDRAFLSDSFREAWRRRRPLYLGLSATWILLGCFLVQTVGNAITNAQRIGLNWWQYLATEPGVILYYLRLSVWPFPLCLNHPWQTASAWMSVLAPTVVVVILLGATAWAWRRTPISGFLGAWFFLILAPSSSFIPLHDPIYEHRVYLSLAAVVSLVVLGLYSLMGRRSLAMFVVVAIGLGFLTWRRNQTYRNEVTLWSDTVAKFPNDPLAHYNWGVVLWQVGRVQEAIGQYERALQIDPHSPGVHTHLGFALAGMGRVQEAIRHYEQALQLDPNNAEAHNDLGAVLSQLGRVPEAIEHWERAVWLKPDYVEAHYNLGVTLAGLGKVPEAIAHLEQVLRLKPDYAEAHYNLGVVLAGLGKVPEAVKHWEQASLLKPDYAEAHNNLGSALLKLGKVPEAIEHYEQAVRVKPHSALVHYNLGLALERMGQVQEAIGHYEQAVRLKPDYGEAQDRLARLRTGH